MFLSDQQSAAARFGLLAGPTFEWVDLPVGPQPLSTWAKGLHVHWMDGYANAPCVRLKVDGDVREWPGKAWSKSGHRYMAVHEDGRAHAYYHGGPVGPVELTHWENGAGVPYTALATTQDEGLAGSHVSCLMADGEHAGQIVILRGPWCGATPEGYVDTPYVDMADRHSAFWQSRPWHERGGIGGLLVREDLFLRLLARFAPECRCARVTSGGRSALEVVKGDWGEPKTIRLAARRRGAA